MRSHVSAAINRPLGPGSNTVLSSCGSISTRLARESELESLGPMRAAAFYWIVCSHETSCHARTSRVRIPPRKDSARATRSIAMSHAASRRDMSRPSATFLTLR